MAAENEDLGNGYYWKTTFQLSDYHVAPALPTYLRDNDYAGL